MNFKPWGTPPEEQGFQGGDLLGIVDKLDYLQDLGINALYFNPIFSSAANHRYHTFDYFQVDPLLGGDQAFRELLDAAHARGIRIVLDGVFNHASRGFWPFHHILETGGNSPYIDWFTVEGWPLRPYVHDEENPHNYAAWWSQPALPKLNTANPAVQEYIFEAARYWLEFGIDGWRLDVPAEIDDDVFWRKFRQVVKEANPEAYICGEIWWNAWRWLQGDQFDAVMNYLITSPLISFFGARTLRPGYEREHLTIKPIDASAFASDIEAMYGLYDWEINYAQMNMLDSHDMARALWIMRGDTSALKLCVLAMMTLPGAPCVYYGDEIGLAGGEEPYCRAAFPWDDEATWDQDLLGHYRAAIALRNAHPVLRTGTFETLYAAGEVYAQRRTLDGQEAVVVFNAADQETRVEIPLPNPGGANFDRAWPGDAPVDWELNGGVLQAALPARGALVIIR